MDKQIRESIDAFLVMRSYWYATLHGVFGGEPTIGLLAAIDNQPFGEMLDLCADSDGDAFSLLKEVVLALDTSAASIDALKSEYTVLFVGPAKLAAPPWESVYVGQENRLLQESTLAVRYAYAEFGYLPKECRKVADDHIALMMDFMAHMARRSRNEFAEGSTEALLKLLSAQSAFIDEHLLNWVPAYATALSGAGTSPFYPRFADAALAFFRKDRTGLDEILAMLES